MASLHGIIAAAGLGFASAAQAYEVRARWVSRVGNVDTVVPGPLGFQMVDASAIPPGTVLRFRIQFGAFDDGAGPAPAGGFLGWNVGTLIDDRTPSGFNTRTPGRLAPFTFAPNPPGNGLPTADPWTALTAIDNTLGIQVPPWHGMPGTADPGAPPAAFVRGRNTFVSTYEISTTVFSPPFSITAGGNLLAALTWNVVQQIPPEPGDDGFFGPGDANGDGIDDGEDDIAGNILYAPLADAPRSFTNELRFIPSPGSVALLGLSGLLATRRRRA